MTDSSQRTGLEPNSSGTFLRILAVVFFLGGPVLGVFGAIMARNLEDQNGSKVVTEYVSERAATLKRETFIIAEALYHLRAFVSSSKAFSRDEFRSVTREMLARHPVIASVEWMPRVTAEERPAHERVTHLPGVDRYRIWARDSKGEAVPAPAKSDYYPIHYFEPLERGRQVLGLDLSLDPARRLVLESSIARNEVAVTNPINLSHERQSKGFLALLPVYGQASTGPPSQPVPRGMIGIVIRAREMFLHTMSVLNDDSAGELYFELFDESVNGKQVAFASSGDSAATGKFLPQTYSVTMEVGGQRWRLSARPSAAFLDRHRTRKPIALGIGVFLFWELLGGMVLAFTHQAHRGEMRSQSLVYESAVRSLSEGVVVAGNEGRFLLFNHSAEHILGLGAQDLPVQDWSGAYGCFLPDRVTPFPSHRLPLARALAGETSTEEIYIRNPGVPGGVWITSSGAPIRDARGSVVGGVVTLRDITAWKEASESLRASLKELKDLKYAVDQAAIVAITSLDGKMLYVNGKFSEVSGFSEEEILGQNHRVLNSGYHPPAFFEDLWKKVSSGAVWRGVMRNRARDGSLYWVDTTIVPLLNQAGECERYLAISSDVTARKLQEQNLQLLSNAVEQTADAVFITDASGLISYVNPAFESITGFSRQDALGKTPRILKSGTNEPRYYEELWRTILSGRSFRSQTINRKKNGGLFEAEQTITPIRDSEGRIANFVSVVKDITDRVMRQRQEIEMRYAAQVQRQLYPSRRLELEGYDVAGSSFAAESACGDYYDYLQPEDNSLCLVLGDVSGHGLAPAIIMASTRSYLRYLIRSQSDLSQIMRTVNEVLYADLERSRFVALLLANIDVAGRRLNYVNAGMTEGFILDGNGAVKAVLPTCGPPLGLLPDVDYRLGVEVHLEPGDLVVLMTDGVVEARDPEDNFLEIEGALAVVRRHLHESAEQIVQRLYEEVGRFSQGAPQLDDITAIVCKVGETVSAAVAGAGITGRAAS